MEIKFCQLIHKAEALLAECSTVTIAYVNSDGFPSPVPMAKGETQGYLASAISANMANRLSPRK